MSRLAMAAAIRSREAQFTGVAGNKLFVFSIDGR